MHGGQLHRLLMGGILVPFRSAEIDHTSRALRAAGLMPIGGRGPHAAQLTAQHVANLIVGMNAPTASRSAEFVVTWNSTSPADGEAYGFAGCETFGEALTAILEDSNDRLEVANVVINLDWPQAEINLDDGRKFKFGSPEDARRLGYTTTASHRQFFIGPGALSQIAIHLQEELDGDVTNYGWVEDENDPLPRIKVAAGKKRK